MDNQRTGFLDVIQDSLQSILTQMEMILSNEQFAKSHTRNCDQNTQYTVEELVRAYYSIQKELQTFNLNYKTFCSLEDHHSETKNLFDWLQQLEHLCKCRFVQLLGQKQEMCSLSENHKIDCVSKSFEENTKKEFEVLHPDSIIDSFANIIGLDKVKQVLMESWYYFSLHFK